MPKIRKRDTSAWIKAVAASYGKKVGEIGYLFCDDEKILEVNREYLQHDYYTDSMTFVPPTMMTGRQRTRTDSRD